MSRITKPTLNKNPLQIPHLVNHQPFAQHSFVQPKHQIKPIKQSNYQQKPKVIVNPNSGNIPLASNRQPSYSNLQPDDFANLDHCMELFLTKASNRPLHQAIESFFKARFSPRAVYFWEEISGIQTLYSPTANLTTLHSNGIVGYSVFSRTIINTSSPTQHPSYQTQSDGQLIHPNNKVLIFPLWDHHNSIYGVVEIIRDDTSPEFTKEDEAFAKWFTNRFKQLSQWFAPAPGADILPLLLEITDLQRADQFLNTAPQRISSFFNCRKCEIWRFDPEKKEFTRFGVPSTRFAISQGGIAGDVLNRKQAVHVINCRLSPSYNPEVDGDSDESVLVVPVSSGGDDQNMSYAIALRGPNERIFTTQAQNNLNALAPFILQALTNADTFSAVDDEFEKTQLESEGLAGLLQVVEELSQHLDTKVLIDQIMEKGRALTDSDRCSLFLVNEKRDKLISFLHQGLKTPIELPIGKGIAGQTVNNGKIMNIADAYDCEYFDRNTDKESGYRTKSILSVPIPNNRGEIIGVTEMVNKKNGHTFTEWDTKVIQIFNVFAGISLENAKLYEDSKSMSTQLRSFFDISFSMAKSEDIRPLLQDIMGNARKTIGATRASIFLLDETANCFSTFLAETDDEKSVPATLPVTNGIISAVAKSKNGLIENDVYHNPNFNRAVDINTGFKTVSILASPIFDKTNKLIGVVEMLNKQSEFGKDEPFSDRDLEILNAFSSFSSVAIENCRLKDIVQNGDVEVELYKWIGESERQTYDIPTKLQLTNEQKRTVLQLNFFSVDFIGIDHFKELFFFFNRFNLLETFKVTNAQFFRFISTVSRAYSNPPYHNWVHACDVSQYVSYEIETADLTKVLTKFEIFGLLVACICHDTNHQGFNNIYNIKAETPLGILYKDQSVMEMHHITQSIPIICQDDINLFQALSPVDVKKVWNLSPVEVKKMWNLFIKLILATDMSKHFDLVKRAQAALDANEWDINNPEHHTLALQLLLKVGDISNVSRPFELADKWCDILNTEFFRQGDLEKSSGIGLTSPLNDREHPDKPKSQIGFYNFICIPLYQTIARVFPPLQVNVDSLKNNLSVWMELAAANKAKEEAEKAKQEAEKAKNDPEKEKEKEKTEPEKK